MATRRWWIGLLLALVGPGEDGEAASARADSPPPSTGFRTEAPGIYVWDETRTEIEAWQRELRGLEARAVPQTACGVCRRLRDDCGEWRQPAQPVDPHALSHGLCPDCARRNFPGLLDDDRA